MLQRSARTGRMKALLIITVVACALGAVAAFASPLAATAAEGPVSHDIRPGPGGSALRWLSDYLPSLEHTAGDTPVYVMRGEKPGGTALVLGGTHPSEIAGVMAATLLVERGEPVCGTLIVIPHTNNSAARLNVEYLVEFNGEERSVYPFSGSWVALTNATGEQRQFRYGARFTQPVDQGADDPEIYVHPSGFENRGFESRNLDRVHPGRAEGTLTERISYALFRLVEEEAVDVVIDMHESSPVSSLAHTLICHPRALDVGSMALFDLETAGIYLKLEISRPEHAGISHWEFGQNADVLSFLIETPNPGQDWSRALPEFLPHAADGSTPATQRSPDSADDPAEQACVEPDVVNDPQYPLSSRVHEQLATVQAILANHTLFAAPDSGIEIAFPFELSQLDGSDLGSFLR